MTLVEPADILEVKGTETHKLGRKRDHTRDPEILACAVEVLSEVGYDGMTVEMVATRAKAGKATLYRRWASKEDLVIDAVACLKREDIERMVLPDTGTLRGDLVAMIRPHSIEDNDKNVRVMAGLMSLVTRNPELGDSVFAAVMEPRMAITRQLFQRAIDRGEIAADLDLETIMAVSPAMVSHRTLMLKKPVDRPFLIRIIDNLILPAVGIEPSV
ncbi:AcrR family transcriptional regulator (plasmid) [Frondihabitans sp. PAMC 28766]|uniref:TetR/AcrR family transcriptional regulator n=1 Tax=Frondihabitans sp. PAMC 28766 TaxID=1795630 RepID=UPI00078BD50C|nr:TetR/AcrR family transcriptional regulator [Frondihabitans sp. PAMC 28766]AMM22899.1 AcrR family transcriptional regulator [Frondihabitans sp. PAMC 28766]